MFHLRCNTTVGHDLPTSVKDKVISQGVLSKFHENKTLRKFPNLQYLVLSTYPVKDRNINNVDSLKLTRLCVVLI